MFNLENKILESINLQKGLPGLTPGTLVLQKAGKRWKPAIVIGSKEQGSDVQLWTAEEEGNREIKYVCWGSVLKPKIKIVKKTILTGLTLKNLLISLREFSQEASKQGIGKILERSSDIFANQ